MSVDTTTEDEGEGYFASVSDLMVGVLFIFLLMLTVFAMNFRDDSAELERQRARAELAEQLAANAKAEAERQQETARLATAEAERQQEAARLATVLAEQQKALATRQKAEVERLEAFNRTLLERLAQAAIALQRELQDREEARAGLLQRLARGLEARGIRFVLDQQSGVLRLSEEVPFDTSRSDLTPRTKRTVQALAEVLEETLPCFAQGTDRRGCGGGDASILEAVLVEGHTDSQAYMSLAPAQSQQENDRLSTLRALSVFAELRQHRPNLEALRNTSDQPLLGVSGYGERRPLSDRTSLLAADLMRNRRIDLRFVLSARTSNELRRLLDDIGELQRRAQQ